MLEFPTGEYKTVVIDPPWEYGAVPTASDRTAQSGAFATNPYKMMTLSEIQSLPLQGCFAPDAFLFLWATHRYLQAAFDCLSTWGVRYRFMMTWHKNGGMQPLGYPQLNSEFVLVGVNGSPRFINTKSFKTCFSAPQRGHSVKPAEFYNMLARVTPAPRIDLFSRRLIPDFDTWGDEAVQEPLECSQLPMFANQ